MMCVADNSKRMPKAAPSVLEGLLLIGKWLLNAVILMAGCNLVLLHNGAMKLREEVHRIPIPGHPRQAVIFYRIHTVYGETTEYSVTTTMGEIVKRWLSPHATSPEEIRRRCQVEYDGEKLRVIGPARNVIEYPFDLRGK